MTFKDIAWQSLRRRKAKAAFVLVGLSIGVAAMVALVGLAEGLTREINHKLEKYGANMIITPKSEQLSLAYEGLSMGGFSFETTQLKEADLAGIKSIKNSSNIAAVGPMVLGPVMVGNQAVLLAGMDFGTVDILKPWWKIQGRDPNSDQVIAGSRAAQTFGLKIGREIQLQGRNGEKSRTLTVSGILGPTGSQDDNIIFTPLKTAQDILDKPGEVSMVEVAALCMHCPVDEMVDQLSGALPGASVMAIRSVVEGRMETLKMFKKISLGGSIMVVLIGGLVVLVTMMGSVKERTSEIGIFRAIGFRKGHVMRIVLIEALILSAGAGMLGYLLGLGGGEAVMPLISGTAGAHIPLDPLLPAGALLMALVVGLVSSIYPALTAARLDPSEALRSI